MVMFDLAWLMSKDLSDMLWCVSPSEQPGPPWPGRAPPPVRAAAPPCPVQGPGGGDSGASWAQRVLGWGLGRQPFPADRPALLPSKLECEV